MRVVSTSQYSFMLLIDNTYEINRRFIFMMRVLGLGLKGAQKFCGFIDIPQFLFHHTYDMITANIRLYKNSLSTTFKECH